MINTIKFIIILAFFQRNVASTTVGYHYKSIGFNSRTTWLCNAKNTYTDKSTATECALFCGQKADEQKSLCSAIKFESATKTCIGCIQCGISNTVTAQPSHPKSDFNKFLIFPDFDVDINQDLIFYLDFETIPAGANGSTSIIGGGVNGSAVRFPNPGDLSGDAIYLDQPEAQCLHNLTLCPNGVTLALWIRLEGQTGSYPNLVRSLATSIGCQGATAPHSNCWFVFNHITGKMKQYKYETAFPWPWATWYHIVMTYKDGLGFNVYLNGCPLGAVPEANAANYTDPQAVNIPRRLSLGCGVQDKTKHCTNSLMDDLYLWHGHKSYLFAYHLYTMYNP